jgi:uncharacterized membrane protein YidH (DUF202 family)
MAYPYSLGHRTHRLYRGHRARSLNITEEELVEVRGNFPSGVGGGAVLLFALPPKTNDIQRNSNLHITQTQYSFFILNFFLRPLSSPTTTTHTHTLITNPLARERTFDGAYWRTAMKSFSMGMIIIRLFTRSFYKIGILFVAFGMAMLGISVLRRKAAGDVFDQRKPFETSGFWVMMTTFVTTVAYIIVFVLVMNLK